MNPAFIFLLFASTGFALELSDLPPARMSLAQTTPSAAVSSQAVATQPSAPSRKDTALPPAPPVASKTKPPTPPKENRKMDPLLDTNRPKDCQLVIETEQTIQCGETAVVMPAGTYKQVTIVESKNDRRAIDLTNLQSQENGLGYVRYLSDTPMKFNGVERDGGLDVPVRDSDHLPVRIWYRKMKEPDDLTKAFAFILPPVALITGAGAWSSGNTLLPDTPPTFTEYRDYYVKPPKAAPNPNEIPKPSHVSPLGNFSVPGTSNLRSK